MKTEKKDRLIKALETERDQFEHRGQSTKEHDIAIQYLKTGVITHTFYDYELLDAIMFDFDMICKDYGI